MTKIHHLHIRIPAKLWERIRRHAKRLGVNATTIITTAADKFLKEDTNER